jgi:hypothetical protein
MYRFPFEKKWRMRPEMGEVEGPGTFHFSWNPVSVLPSSKRAPKRRVQGALQLHLGLCLAWL